MSEFVAHEVEISTVDCGQCHQAYHLMEGYAACYSHIAVSFHHVPVHLVVDEAEYHSLVSYQSLIVAFHVAYCLFVVAAVGQFPEYGCRMPVLVFLFFKSFYPVVRYSHRHAVIESHTSFGEGECQTRHSAHFFSDGDGVGIDLMYQYIGKCEICYGICVFCAVVVVGIASESLTESVAIV